MLNYLSKFVLQMLPTISATVIGAYIVSTWINPKMPPEPAKVAARAQEPAKPAAEPQPAQDSADAAENRPADARPAEAKPVETPKPVKAASAPEKVRVIPIVKSSSPAGDPAAVTTASASEATTQDERRDANKDANELARAAILRLRGNDSARAAEEPSKPVAAMRAQPPRVAPDVPPPPVATVAPPLPPAVSIVAPRIAGEGTGEAAAYPERMSPPGEIPVARNPLNLQASARIPENPSIADDFLSATKSFFRAITP
jgi:hypothetical protein